MLLIKSSELFITVLILQPPDDLLLELLLFFFVADAKQAGSQVPENFIIWVGGLAILLQVLLVEVDAITVFPKHCQIIIVWTTQRLFIEVFILDQINNEPLWNLEFILGKHEVIFLNFNNITDNGIRVCNEDIVNGHFQGYIQEVIEEAQRNDSDQS